MHRAIVALTGTVVLMTGGPALAATPSEFNYRTVTHIGMVVHDVNKTARAVADVFDLQMPSVIETRPETLADDYDGDPQAHTRVADLHFDNIVLEITQPVGGKSPWRDYLDRYGEGLHHLAFDVPGVDDYVELLELRGGTRTLGTEGSDYALVDLMSSLGIVIELTEALPGTKPTPLVRPANPSGLKALARIGLMVEDGDRFRANWISLFGVPVEAPLDTAGGNLQFPDDFHGDPRASNREIYVPLANMWVNLIQPVGGKSPWRDLLERRQGAHYINFFVDDVNATDAYLTSKGGHRILGNATAGYSYNDMHDALGGLTVLLLRAQPAVPQR